MFNYLSARFQSPSSFRSIWFLRSVLVAISTLVVGCDLGESADMAIQQSGDAIERASKSIESGAKSFEDISGTLRNLQEELSSLNLKVQQFDVDEFVARTATTVEATSTNVMRKNLDFARSRVVEDLRVLKAAVTGGTPPTRTPVLDTSSITTIDLCDNNSLTVYGWNIGVASANRDRYPVYLIDSQGTQREIDDKYIAYMGDYAVQIVLNETPGNRVMQFSDRKIAITGYRELFEVSNTTKLDPVPAYSLTTNVCDVKTFQTFTTNCCTLIIEYIRGYGTNIGAKILSIKLNGAEVLEDKNDPRLSVGGALPPSLNLSQLNDSIPYTLTVDFELSKSRFEMSLAPNS